ncbi:hypothetical protein ACQP3F_32910, partial [Escherichia coli]
MLLPKGGINRFIANLVRGIDLQKALQVGRTVNSMEIEHTVLESRMSSVFGVCSRGDSRYEN